LSALAPDEDHHCDADDQEYRWRKVIRNLGEAFDHRVL